MYLHVSVLYNISSFKKFNNFTEIVKDTVLNHFC